MGDGVYEAIVRRWRSADRSNVQRACTGVRPKSPIGPARGDVSCPRRPDATARGRDRAWRHRAASGSPTSADLAPGGRQAPHGPAGALVSADRIGRETHYKLGLSPWPRRALDRWSARMAGPAATWRRTAPAGGGGRRFRRGMASSRRPGRGEVVERQQPHVARGCGPRGGPPRRPRSRRPRPPRRGSRRRSCASREAASASAWSEVSTSPGKTVVTRDAGARELVAQRLGEALVGGLGGAVDGAPGEGAQRGARADHDDVAAAGVEHRHQRRRAPC